MAATALLAVKPFETLAHSMAPVTGYSANNKVVLLHTGNNNNKADRLAVQQVTDLKKNTGNVLLLNAGKETQKNIAALEYDASLHLNNSVLNNAGNYKIVYKGDIKVGIITAGTDTMTGTNTLSAYLKKDKGCQLVVVLSQLGYKNDSGNDDLELARGSAYIDIIIGGHSSNFCASPVIAHNRWNEEVIIHSAADNGFALGNIEIGFDRNHNKRSVDFNNLLSRVN